MMIKMWMDLVRVKSLMIKLNSNFEEKMMMKQREVMLNMVVRRFQ
tara:strand:+ start:663 stop:797 length:135 start_codon:yes stop_codon:yes gene_type:complete